MQLAGGAVCVWLLVSLGFHFPAPWKLICTCTKYTHRASCCMSLLSVSTEEVYVIAQGAKCRLGLNSRRCVSYLWGQQNQIAEGSKIPEFLWHPSSLPGRPLGFYGHHLQQLLSPTAANPPSRSCTNAGAKCVDLVLDERNVKPCPHNRGRAHSTTPLVCTWPSPVGSIVSIFILLGPNKNSDAYKQFYWDQCNALLSSFQLLFIFWYPK